MEPAKSDDRIESILEFDGVSISFDQATALNNLSFCMLAGETRVIFGAAGSGKTVLLKVAIGLIKPDSGRVYLFGQEITRLEERALFNIRSRVGVLFQEGGLFDSLTVGSNVAYPLLHAQAQPSKNGLQEISAKVQEALSFVELENTFDKFPDELSGGMRRRVGIARAVVTEPPLVLYDSPTAGLDPITAHTIMALIAKERDLRNTANVIVTHRYQDGQLMAGFRYNPHSGKLERVSEDALKLPGPRTVFMVLREGRLVFEGSQKELEASSDPYVAKFVRH
jgi:phospholipid/cholesterol/gamma-HCH transport system ATP-binding protein